VDDGVMQTVAVVGDESARAELLELRTPVDAVLEELTHAERWGDLWFVPEERSSGVLDGVSWVPELPASDAPDAWRPMDLLCGLLHDDAGRLRGVLSMDLPTDGLRPGPQQRRVLQHYVRQAERALMTALERGELADDLERERTVSDYRRHLIDVLSHDVLNNVTAIGNAVELLRMELELPQDVEQGLGVVDRGAGVIRTLVEDMRLLAALGEEGRPARSLPVDLAEVVRDVCLLQLPGARRRQIDLTVSTPGETLVLGDPVEFDRLVTNLVSNAVKYSDAGGVVEASVLRTDGEAELRVTDHGLGISEEDQHRLFDEFFRAQDDAVRRRPGLGLGLAIVQRIARRHQARVTVASRLGEGSTFRVILPRLP